MSIPFRRRPEVTWEQVREAAEAMLREEPSIVAHGTARSLRRFVRLMRRAGVDATGAIGVLSEMDDMAEDRVFLHPVRGYRYDVAVMDL